MRSEAEPSGGKGPVQPRSRIAEALARWRVTLGFVCGALVLWLARPTPTTLVYGGVLASFGEALRFWAAGHLNKSQEVTMSGPYRWLAHPLYVGSSIMGLGLALACGTLPVALLVAAYLLSTIGAAVRTEERFLRTVFGDRYDRYRSTHADPRQEAARRFSFEQALRNREYRAAAGVLIALLLLYAKAVWISR